MNDPTRDDLSTPRRRFLLSSGAVAATAMFGAGPAPARRAAGQEAPPVPPAPPAAADGQAITRRTIAEAEKLAGVEFTDAERDQIVASIAREVERMRSRRSVEMPNALAPAQVFDPRLPGRTYEAGPSRFVSSPAPDAPLPGRDADIAFAPVTALSAWIARGAITSERLTRIYLDRLRRHGPKLECVVTLTEDRALAQARKADAELALGVRRGPLHGIPWGAKDLFDTAGIATTWGATPYRDRVAETDAFVVRALDEAGAVLVAKLTLGALAYGDIWFAGRTRNPFNAEQGSSGSSAGSAAATAAGLVGFSLGTETLGSIVSPCMRCGTTGLRPTFGRVARTGAMALCWSLDKIGPICRTVEDCALVLDAINGADDGDPASIDMPLHFDGSRPIAGLRVGYDPAWFEGRRALDLDRTVLETARAAGLELVEIRLPELPYDTLLAILHAEAASAFEELTLSNRDDELVWQDREAWPNTFRRTRFMPAVEYVQAERFRRQVCDVMAAEMDDVDGIIGPSFAGSMLLITNATGHPSLTFRTGFRSNGRPHGMTLWGRLYDEGTILRIGMELERRLGVWSVRPEL